ncbi:HNH endonuclease [Mycobacterium sp. NPDC048908]|uniref:HNH endonuclease n=1 Tax=Mycobacterium sp. NPDC048908 TaxID=3364292 RepID=UPI00371475E4
MFDSRVLAVVDPLAEEAALVERIAWLEAVKSAAAAGQARAAAALAEARRAAEAAAGVPAAKQGRGVASEVALARRESPNQGGRLLGLATALVHEMPHTLAAMECGALSEWRATLIARESACLSVAHRRLLDAEMCAEVAGLAGCGDGRISARAKEIAARLDAAAVVDRAAKAEADRTATIRPAPDCMAYVTVLLPMRQGVGMWAALKRQADVTVDERSRGQVMADTAYERITGCPAEQPQSVALNLVMTDAALWGADNAPAVVAGYGPIPASLAQQLVADAVTEATAVATLRRLYRHPGSGALVAMESRARLFPKGLAAFIGIRDRTCRTPYCDAPIRHRDHATPRNRGGPTSALNGLGECERCNYVKETPGWQVSTSEDNATHTADFVTPTGAAYRSTAPPLPGAPMITISELEVRIGVTLTDLHAA